jgi:hypothetical protein
MERSILGGLAYGRARPHGPLVSVERRRPCSEVSHDARIAATDVEAWWSRVRQGTTVARWTRPGCVSRETSAADESWAFHVKRPRNDHGHLSTTSQARHLVIGMIKRE